MTTIAMRGSGPTSAASVTGTALSPAAEPLVGPLLLVEGSRGRRAALQHALARRGFHVTSAADTTWAASAMADVDFGYAVIGLPLRGVGGLAFVRRLRERCPAMRIVVVTDADSFASVILALGAGADDYLPQAAGEDTLVDALAGPSTRAAARARDAAGAEPHLLGTRRAYLRAVRPQRHLYGEAARDAPAHPPAPARQAGAAAAGRALTRWRTKTSGAPRATFWAAPAPGRRLRPPSSCSRRGCTGRCGNRLCRRGDLVNTGADANEDGGRHGGLLADGAVVGCRDEAGCAGGHTDGAWLGRRAVPPALVTASATAASVHDHAMALRRHVSGAKAFQHELLQEMPALAAVRAREVGRPVTAPGPGPANAPGGRRPASGGRG